MRNKVPGLNLELGEVGLLIVLWVSSGYMFIESYEYSGWDGGFPRIIAAVVFLMVSMLLIREHLPKALYIFVGGETLDISSIEEDESQDEVEHDPDRMNPVAFGVLMLTTGFVGLSYLIGMVWATPVYILVYMRWAGYRWRSSILLAVGMLIIAYGMFMVFNFPIGTGLIHDMLGIA